MEVSLKLPLTEHGDIHQHERDQDQDDGPQAVGSLLESHAEHVHQLLDVDNGEVSPEPAPVADV